MRRGVDDGDGTAGRTKEMALQEDTLTDIWGGFMLFSSLRRCGQNTRNTFFVLTKVFWNKQSGNPTACLLRSPPPTSEPVLVTAQQAQSGCNNLSYASHFPVRAGSSFDGAYLKKMEFDRADFHRCAFKSARNECSGDAYRTGNGWGGFHSTNVLSTH